MTDDTIVIKAPAGTKARWVKYAHPGKLSAWVVKMIDEPPGAERRLAPRELGGATRMTPAQFAALAALIGRGPSHSTDAARLQLVDGLGPADAARQAGCSPNAAWNSARRYRASLALAMLAAGVAKADGCSGG